jgi:chromosomal replication initiation ATPase DnaA
MKNLSSNYVKRNQVKEEQIISTVCKYFNIKSSALLSKRRDEHIAIPRMFVSWFLRKRLNYQLKTIGVVLGRDHSTIIHHLNTFNDFVGNNKSWRENMEVISDMLAGEYWFSEVAEKKEVALFQLTITENIGFLYTNYA